MNLLKITTSYFKEKWTSKVLAITLMTFGVAIINCVILFTHQLEQTLLKNSADIDLVIGSKGSPLQIVLSSVYHIDFPTGNIPLEKANQFSAHPLVRESLPLSIGDNYNGFRIVGTSKDFVRFFDINISSGAVFSSSMEAVLGSEAAKKLGLKAGDYFHSAHGFSEDAFHHADAPFTVTGILERTGAVTDNLIFTDLNSIWELHHQEELNENENEITSLLIRYKSPMAVAMFPAIVNQTAALQAASPAFETARLLSVFGNGIDLFKALGVAILLMAISGVFISLYNSISERKYDIALIRTMGASKKKVFFLLLGEGMILSFSGVIAGIFTSHIALAAIDFFIISDQHMNFSAIVFIKEEMLVLFFSICAGVAASIIPSFKAYNTDISDVLAKG
jgi:putative ABC transport system permease protein